MAIDVSFLTDYSWADIAKAAKGAMMSSAIAKEYTINGRKLGRCTMAEAIELYNLATSMAAQESDSDNTGGTALVQFGEPQ